MGKVDLAFDHSTELTHISKLSLVLYEDSFFYGLWNDTQFLIKCAYHPYSSLSNVCELISFHHQLDAVQVVSTVQPYSHLPVKLYAQEHFEDYFVGLYELDRLDDHVRMNDVTEQGGVATLHCVDEDTHKVIGKFWPQASYTHVSTAIHNYLSEGDHDIVFYASAGILHAGVFGKRGFELYNQFPCYYDTDYLYFIKLILHSYRKKKHDRVTLSGDLSCDPCYNLLNKYFSKTYHIEDDLKVVRVLDKAPYNYFDLYLASRCAS